MSRNPSANLDNKVYVGDLGNNASKGELEDAFSYYGRLRSVWVARNPPGFAFIEFEDARDAEDAVRGLDGRTVCGRRCRVELSTGRTRSRGYSGPSRRGRPFHPEDRCYECGSRGHYARDCPLYSRGRRRGSRSNSRSRSRSRSRNRSRSRSNSRRSRSIASRSKNRSRSRSTSRQSRRSRSTSRHSRRTRSPTRSKSKSISRRSASKSDRSQSRGRSRDRSPSRDRSRDVSRDRSLSASRSRSRSSKRSVSPRANGDD